MKKISIHRLSTTSKAVLRLQGIWMTHHGALGKGENCVEKVLKKPQTSVIIKKLHASIKNIELKLHIICTRSFW